MFLCAADGWRVGISEYAMYAQASGRLKADAVCTILKALLAIRPDGWLHGSTICPRGKEQCGRSNLDLEAAVPEKAREYSACIGRAGRSVRYWERSASAPEKIAGRG